jgi:hypothetical protein
MEYIYNHCNICNISIYFCNIHINACNITLKHLQHLKIDACNMCFQAHIYLLLTKWWLVGVWSSSEATVLSPLSTNAIIDQIDSAYHEAARGPLCGHLYPWAPRRTRSPYSRRRSPHHHQISRRAVDLVKGGVSRVERRRAARDADKRCERVDLSRRTYVQV